MKAVPAYAALTSAQLAKKGLLA
jgi:hypothetical protein